MKVTFNWGIKTYSGFGDNNVYGKWLNGRLCISRNYKYPKLTPNNAHLGAIGKNLYSLFLDASAAYKADFVLYRDRRKLMNYSRNPAHMKQIGNTFCLFVDMMFAWQASDPAHVDLTAVTLADIVSSDADVRTVARAIDAGFLRSVKDHNALSHDIQI